MADIKYYFPGISLIIVAVLIIAFPEILIAMIAATLAFIGVATLYIGHKLRKGFDEFGYINGSAFDQFLIDQPIFRRWVNRV